MDRNGLACVFLLLFLILSNFSDASLISNYMKFSVTEKDSLPGLSGDKKPDENIVNGTKIGGNKLDSNESSKETKLGSETENKTSKEHGKLAPKEVNQADKDKKSDSKIVKGESEKLKPGSEQVNPANKENKLDSGSTENKPSNEEKPVDNPKKEESGPEKKHSEENEKPGSESGKDAGKEKKLDSKPVKEVVNPEPQVPKDFPVSKSSSDKSGENSPPPNEKTGKKEEEEGKKKKKTEDKSETGVVTSASCDGLSRSCVIQKDLIGCIKNSDDDSKVVVVVQNKGESDLKANVSAEATGKGVEYNIPKKKSKMISVAVKSGKISSLVFHGADGKCEVPLHQSESGENYPFRLPTYDKLVTPVNGAYFLILSVVIFGGTFMCITFSRKRRQGGGGIPYQELEMGIPESVSAADLESAEGWDEGWDDDWDNENSVKSPAARHAGNISANGLTSRTTNKDGWEDNWEV